jgi:colanic acid/amylovoran biosynthesis glycosyltransferase
MVLIEKPRVLIFRHELLPWSETFVADQAENLRRYAPIYCGLRRVPGLQTAREKTIIIRDPSRRGWVRGQLFRVFRWSPFLIAELRRRGVRLIHAHFEGGGMALTRMARTLGIPLLVTFHGIDVTKENQSQWPNPVIRMVWLRRRAELQRQGHLFLGVSSFIRGRMIDLGYPAERTRVHYTGVDISSALPNQGIAREPTVLFAGRLVEKKGCRFALEAMQTVQAVAPELQLLVAGDGPLRHELEAEARSRRLNAKFLGQRTKDEVIGWMGRSRLLCAPYLPASDGDTDGCPTTLLEAQAAGLPAIAFSHGGSIEALNHGATGLLVPVGDSAALAASILQLCRDPALWKQLSLAGRSWVEEQFDLRKQNARLEELYDRALDLYN